ncbi:MAG: M48 family metallopeptidase [Lachnospiraceae bacterium]|nr:M48 family metallopeptidase [Lachnospiraceae bacterium]
MEHQMRIIRSKRKTVVIQITRDGEIVARAPRFMSEKEIIKFAEKHGEWIEKNLAKIIADKENAEPAFSDEEIRNLIRKAKTVIPEKVAYYAECMGVNWGTISVRRQSTIWGSCSMKGNLSFNCLLMLMPESVLDYVIVHELAHRIQMNHSKIFWAEVEKVIPDYRKRRDWLKREGGKYLNRVRK